MSQENPNYLKRFNKHMIEYEIERKVITDLELDRLQTMEAALIANVAAIMNLELPKNGSGLLVLSPTAMAEILIVCLQCGFLAGRDGIVPTDEEVEELLKIVKSE